MVPFLAPAPPPPNRCWVNQKKRVNLGGCCCTFCRSPNNHDLLEAPRIRQDARFLAIPCLRRRIASEWRCAISTHGGCFLEPLFFLGSAEALAGFAFHVPRKWGGGKGRGSLRRRVSDSHSRLGSQKSPRETQVSIYSPTRLVHRFAQFGTIATCDVNLNVPQKGGGKRG